MPSDSVRFVGSCPCDKIHSLSKDGKLLSFLLGSQRDRKLAGINLSAPAPIEISANFVADLGHGYVLPNPRIISDTVLLDPGNDQGYKICILLSAIIRSSKQL